MKCIELFAGAGGAALGLESAGIEHAALCEWDPHACATLRAAGLGPVVEGDVRDLDAIAAVAGESCDLLWSSFPCQAFSTAGKRLGAEDPRNGWPWTVDAIDRFKPRWFLGENVRGLLCHVGDCDRRGDPMACPACYLDRVILPQLRERFAHAGYWLIDAADLGVPQHRRRVILWAGPERLHPPKRTHGPGLFTRPWVSMGEALGLSCVMESDSKQRRDAAGAPRGPLFRPSTQPAFPVCSRAPDVLMGPRIIGGGRNASDCTRSYRDLPDEPSTTVAAVQIGNAGPWLMYPSPTVSAVGECKGSGPGGHPEKMQRASDALFMGTGRRRLTVQECAKLQAFPDDHPWQGTKTSQYRQVGNAVCPPMSEAVGRIVVEADRQISEPRPQTASAR